MDPKITRTRVIIPQRRPDQLSRPRVLKRLFAYKEHKLLIVVAPPGYGKTALLIDFAQKASHPFCWYAIDSLDKNPSRFFAHIVASIAHVHDRFGRESLLALQEQMANKGALVDLVPTIVNELYTHVEERFTLVLDDFHLVQENSEIQDFLNAFVQQVEDTCQVVIASRRLIRLPDLPLMVARSLVAGISMEELAFQTDEIQALMAQNYDQAIDEDEALELVDKTEGWITGLLLSTQLTQQNPLGSRHVGRNALQRATGVDLYDYLAQQVFLQQTLEVQAFLLYTSLLDEFNAERCQQIFASTIYPAKTEWQRLIDVVVASNLFILPVGDGEPWYRYHNLFQEFLTRRVHAEKPKEASQILDRLAEHYIEERAWEKAHQVRQQQGNIELIADMIEAAVPALMQECQLPLCNHWLEDLPEHVVYSRPILLAVKGYIYATNVGLTEGLKLLTNATEQLALMAPSLNYIMVLTWSADVHRIMGDFSSSIRDADSALTILDLLCNDMSLGHKDEQGSYLSINTDSASISYGFDPCQAMRPGILCSKGIVYCLNGNVADGIQHLEQAVKIYDALGDSARGALAIMDLATANMNVGRYEEAQTQFHKALERTSTHSRQRLRIHILNNLGVLYHQSGDYVKAHKLLSQAVDSARKVKHVSLHALSLASLGELFVDVMDVESAQECYQEALLLVNERDFPYLTLLIEIARAQLACIVQEWAFAFDCLDRAGRAILANHEKPEWDIYQIAMGQFYLARQNNHQAAEMFGQALEGLTKTKQRIEESQTRLLLAGAYHRLAETSLVMEQLEGAAKIANDLLIWQPLTVKGRMVTDMLNHVTQLAVGSSHGSAVRFATELLSRVQHFEENLATIRRQFHDAHDEPSNDAGIADAGHELMIRTLGRIEITYRDKPIQNWQGKLHISRDLFLCLVAHKNGLSKEAIGALFWPEADSAELKARFKNALYRVRKAFSSDVILFDGEVYQLNRELDLYCDAQAFEEAIANAREAHTPLHEREAYQEALALYQGEYMADVDAIWAWLERERLAQLYGEASLRLAELHLDYGENIEALQLCQTLLANDACLEEAHRMVMHIHAANGNRAALVRQYELCQQSLQDEFGADPSEQTRSLFISLTS